MSFAINAALFNNDDTNNDDLISKKKVSHNTTQKNMKKQINKEKVNSLLQSLHNNTNEEEDNDLGDFTPPPKPISSGAERKTENGSKQIESITNKPLPEYNETKLELNDINKNYGDEEITNNYYKKYIPNYSTEDIVKHIQDDHIIPNNNYYNTIANNNSTNSILMNKLNYMIHLLEEQQDEKVNSVTEEVILYSFLGIFIIFIVDSFSRIGKYTR